MGGRCCSDTFANALSKQLNDNCDDFNYSNDPTGIYTDSAQFIKIYPECTNISVGYRNEHTSSESQDINHLELLSKAVLKVDWENLPIQRKITDNDYDDYDYFDEYPRPSYKKKSSVKTHNYISDNKSWTKEFTIIDPEFYDKGTKVLLNKYTNKLHSIDLCEERLDYETQKIEDLLYDLEIDYSKIEWNGTKLHIEYEVGHSTEATREEMSEYIPSLDFWKSLITELKYY